MELRLPIPDSGAIFSGIRAKKESKKVTAMIEKQSVTPMISSKLPPIKGPTTLVAPLATCMSEIEEII